MKTIILKVDIPEGFELGLVTGYKKTSVGYLHGFSFPYNKIEPEIKEFLRTVHSRFYNNLTLDSWSIRNTEKEARELYKNLFGENL